MIINSHNVIDTRKELNTLTHNEPFYACGFVGKTIYDMHEEDDEPYPAGTVISGKIDGFGATTYKELLEEIKRRKLVKPEEFIS
jgi:hypothetical protein